MAVPSPLKQPASSDASAAGTLRASAVSGGLWMSTQVAVNKVISLGGTLLTMHMLEPQQFGIATLAASVLGVVAILPPFTLTDVLLAQPDALERLMGTANRICIVVTIATVLVLACAGPLAATLFHQPALTEACLVLALRPVAEWMVLVPQTRLRARLRFRSLASIDGSTQTMATILGIAMAWVGFGYESLLLPQILFTALRGWLYRRADGHHQHASPSWVRSSVRPIFAAYLLSGLGQYVHAGMFMLTPLLIGLFGSETDVGFYATASSLSNSINVVVAASIGAVLQPVFAKLMHDRDRQTAAFLRTTRLVAAIAMPTCLLQATLAPVVFRTMLPEKWSGAILMTQALCVGQMFYFPISSAIGLLKAQRRFGELFAWQAAQIVLAGLAMLWIGRSWTTSAGMGITVAAACWPLLSSPVGVWIAIRGRKRRLGDVQSVFRTPLIAAVIAIIPTSLAAMALTPVGHFADWVGLAAIPVLGAFTYLVVLRAIDRALHAELKDLITSTLKMSGLRRTRCGG
jgi:PST family polysaccharide transporter